jgi:predicted enzyme related to lactoylglutathione lyase
MAAKKAAKKKAAAPAKKAKSAPAVKAKSAAKKPTARRMVAKKAAAAKPKHPPVVHWEIQAQDPVRVQKFYGDLFGWAINANNPMNYGMVTSGGGKNAINGGIGGSQSGSRVTVYAQVPSIADTLAKAESLGAQTVMPRTDIGPVIMALFTDPEGNVFGVIEG